MAMSKTSATTTCLTADVRAFLRRFSTIPNAFVDDFLSVYDPCTMVQTDPVIDLTVIARWLKMRKTNLMQTLRQSYKAGIDYVAEPPPPPPEGAKRRHGGHREKVVLLTPDCFKRLCMRSRSAKAEDVRSYFIALESLVLRYREHMVEGMKAEMGRMERAAAAKTLGRRTKAPRAGYIYVIRASDRLDSAYKIGRTVDLRRRLREHSGASAEDLDVVFVLRTEDVVAVEKCITAWMRDRKLGRYREVYQADLDMIKSIVSGCDGIGQLKMHYNSPKPSKLTGGHYLAVLPA